MGTRTVALSLALAALLVPEIASATWAKPLLAGAYLVGPFVLGALSGWRALPRFTGAYLVVAILFQLLLWQDDRTLSGIDDLPPIAGIVFVVPFLLVPMALGAATRQTWFTSGARRSHRA